MTKSNNKTKQTAISPKDFLASVEHPRRREDGFTLLKFFNRVTGMAPKMWGPTIIGFGRYHYKYDSGREGEYLLTGFSPRKSALSIYVMPGYHNFSAELARLGKHKIGKGCLYINKLDDVDMAVLEEIVSAGLKNIRARYRTWDE